MSTPNTKAIDLIEGILATGEFGKPLILSDEQVDGMKEVLAALRSATEQPEPVAWMLPEITDGELRAITPERKFGVLRAYVERFTIPLYAHPQPKEEPVLTVVNEEHLWIGPEDECVDLNQFDIELATADAVLAESERDALGEYDYICGPESNDVDQKYMMDTVRSVVSDAAILSNWIRTHLAAKATTTP